MKFPTITGLLTEAEGASHLVKALLKYKDDQAVMAMPGLYTPGSPHWKKDT